MIISKHRTRCILGALILGMFSVIVHAADAEDAFWDSVVKGNAREEYELYLKQYPKGRHALDARQKLEAMQAKVRAQQELKKKQAEADAMKKAREELQQKEAELKQREEEVVRQQQAARSSEESLRQREAEVKRRDEESKRREIAEADKQQIQQEPLRAGQVFRDCVDCPEMVVIPAGRFEIGSSYVDESPVHTVRIGKAFAMAKTEVTQTQWRSVMSNNPSLFGGCDECPVENVSWNDAQDFVRRLSQKTGKTYRLPSEAEWEYACRAGGRQEYCGSDDANDVAWSSANSNGRTHAVAGKQPNAWGLYDMSGSVWEWTEDCWNANYKGAPTDGSAWMRGNCGVRVLRGGSWKGSPRGVRAAARNGGITTNSIDNDGFRIARGVALLNPASITPADEQTAKHEVDFGKGTLEQYRLALIVASRRYKRYPDIALAKGWQGNVEVHMVIGANGMIASASIKTSSGHEVLDNQALDMLKKGKTTVPIPESLRGREFSIDMPVNFNLINSKP